MFYRMTHEEKELGAWLSAALGDPKACEEFKEAVRAWFDMINDRLPTGECRV